MVADTTDEDPTVVHHAAVSPTSISPTPAVPFLMRLRRRKNPHAGVYGVLFLVLF